MSVNGDFSEMCLRLVAALAAGGIIGLERSYRGRAGVIVKEGLTVRGLTTAASIWNR